MEKINVKTNSRAELIDLTAQVQEVVGKSKVRDGVCFLFCPHTTAGLTINENADPSVQQDIVNTLNRIIPQGRDYTHAEGNSDSHIKSSLLGPDLSIFIESGKLCLGTWQGIYFCEFDGPRNRNLFIKLIEG